MRIARYLTWLDSRFKYIFLKRTLQKHTTNNSVTSKEYNKPLKQRKKIHIHKSTQHYNHETLKLVSVLLNES